MDGGSRAELYFRLLLVFVNSENVFAEDIFLPQRLRIIKAIENHETSVEQVVTELLAMTPTLDLQNKIRHLATAFEHAPALSAEEKFSAPYQRRFESELAIYFLKHPTPGMMESLRLVSEKIIALLLHNPEHTFKVAFAYFAGVSNRAYQDGFGFFDHIPSRDEVIAILRNNHEKDFARILMIQQEIFFDLKNLESIDNIIFPHPKSFVDEVQSLAKRHHLIFFKPSYQNAIRQLTDCYMYNSDLYKNRGRTVRSAAQAARQNFLGIMLKQQDHTGFATSLTDYLPWLPDVTFQYPDFNNDIVKKFLEQEVVYVSGYSGLATCFMSLMLLLGELSTQDNNNYLLAFSMYLVAGGLHSLHEALYPTAKYLHLIKDYEEPRFQLFFNMFAGDEGFQKNYRGGWNNLVSYVRKVLGVERVEVARVDGENSSHSPFCRGVA